MRQLLTTILERVLPESHKTHKVTVLCVEDDQVVRTLLRQVVESFDVMVETASSMGEALSKIPRADILLLDWKLNGAAEGSAVLDAWNREHRSRPVAVVSAMPDVEKKNNLYVRGVSNVFVKPPNILALLEIVRGYVLIVQRQRELIKLRKDLAATRRLCIVLAFIVVIVASGGSIPEWLIN